MATGNPILDQFAVGGQTRQLTSYVPPKPQSERKPPAAIQRLIAELGLRYRPTSQTDLEAHAGALALLARDLADMPAKLLERAIDQYVVSSPYLPKASDLVRIAKSFIVRERPSLGAEGETMAERGNRLMSREHSMRMRWVDDEDGGAHLETDA